MCVFSLIVRAVRPTLDRRIGKVLSSSPSGASAQAASVRQVCARLHLLTHTHVGVHASCFFFRVCASVSSVWENHRLAQDVECSVSSDGVDVRRRIVDIISRMSCFCFVPRFFFSLTGSRVRRRGVITWRVLCLRINNRLC